MKWLALSARILLGLLFLVFGLNGFLNFLPMPALTGLAAQYMGALFVSHYLVFVFLVQIAGGLLLLVNRFVPLALTLLGPVVVNIALFHALLAPAGLVNAVVAVVLWSIVFVEHRRAFSPILSNQTTV